MKLGDWAIWVGSIGTAGTLIFTLIQIYNDKKDRKKNEKESQAKKVSSWIESSDLDNHRTFCRVNNLSESPIYDVVLTAVIVQGAGPMDGREIDGEDISYRSKLKILPPGKYQIEIGFLDYGMCIAYGTELAFKDVNGNSWVRKSNGSLIKIKKEPIEYYDIARPVSWDDFKEI